ncbi:bud site selection protein BUD4-like isoform X1 [Seriola lalandi dorsalis]|uniref:Bud site selection protein BUD4-like n=1 Tax=Seriola lalandi dorsalis TaxID=1841481 RepID=A0A3B4YVD6_SERLL|nr:bud site selection protein BUD4-like isoform X1 [Seriola lalandi dorsalis]
MDESESSLKTLQSETNAPLNAQPLDNPLKTDEQNDTDFNPIRNRRKMGSSRRNKGRQQVKVSRAESYHKPTEDVVRMTRDNKPLETTKMSLTIETAVQEISIETMLDAKETSQTLSVAQATISSPKEELSTNEEQNEHFSLSEVRGAQQSEDAVHEEEDVKLTEMQKMHQLDYSSIKESKPSLESLQSEIWSPLESQPMDNSQSIKEETHSGFKTTRNRRKLGSSRRNKGRQHVPESVTEPYPEEEVVENTWRNEASETEEITSGTGTIWQEELKEHTYSSTIETTDIALRSDKNDFLKTIEEVSEEEKKHIKEPENLTPLTGYDAVKIDLIQSEEASTERTTDAQGPIQVEEREEYEDPANKDCAAQEIDIPNVVTHAELLSAAQNKTDTWDPFDIGHEGNRSANPAMDVSEESGISTAADACISQQDIQEKDKSPVDNSESLQGKVKQKKRKMGSTRRTQLNRKQEGETDNKDETIERNLDMEVDVRKLDRMEVVEELPLIPTTEEKENAQPSLGTVYKEQQETYETSSVHDKRHLQQSSDLQTVESNVKPGTEDSMVLPPEQSASYNEEVVNPVAILHGAYVRDSEGNVDVSVEPPQQDDFASTEMQTASVVAGRNRRSIDQLLSSNTEGAMNTDSDITLYSSETAQSTQNDQALKLTEVPSVAVEDLEKVKSVVRGEAEEEHENAQASAQEPNYVNEGAHNTSPHFSSTNRRRKLGSTRRNLGSRSKGEDLHQKQEVDNEATAINVGDVLTEGVSGIEEKELQIHNEHIEGDSAQRKEKVVETVEYRHTGESQVKPIAYQAVEENPDSLSQLEETEHQLTPDHLPATPSTSPKHDGGRRRKMGSHRKSRGHQHFEDQTEREGRIIDAQKVRDESAMKTAEGHTEESSGLDIISEADECNQKSSSSINISKATEHTRPKSEKAPKWVDPVQYPQAEIRLGQDSQKLSFAGADIRSKSYDVLMVGDSSVGKTSFMKRAQSGKFSLDLPASVGLDSCMWTVVVDGKPVVLQLWDTAGQERFHSITRQVFHKAQAFLLMYDITSSQSFTAVSYWANCIQEGAAEDVTILLLGNKSDHAERQVKTQEGEILAKEYDFQFMECSAATGENVIQSLETVARMLRQKVDTTEEAVVLHKEPPQKKRSGCC